MHFLDLKIILWNVLIYSNVLEFYIQKYNIRIYIELWNVKCTIGLYILKYII